MTGEKYVLRKTQVAMYDVPQMPELSITEMLPHARKIDSFDKFMPDEFLQAKNKNDRKFFWGVFFFLAPNIVESVVNDVR